MSVSADALERAFPEPLPIVDDDGRGVYVAAVSFLVAGAVVMVAASVGATVLACNLATWPYRKWTERRDAQAAACFDDLNEWLRTLW